MRVTGRVLRGATLLNADEDDDPGDPVAWHRQRTRPLQCGVSIGHVAVTAGTLGCFARRGETTSFLVSNNHVLANEDRAVVGDHIVQAGPEDGGSAPDDVIGILVTAHPLALDAANVTDCALAEISADILAAGDLEPGVLRDVRGNARARIVGIRSVDETLDKERVYKVGRTTGATAGRVTAFALDDLMPPYHVGELRFDNQIEIEAANDEFDARDKRPFTAGGDSGAVVVDEDMRGIGLIFARTRLGGRNGTGLAYANPLATVLENLQAELWY